MIVTINISPYRSDDTDSGRSSAPGDTQSRHSSGRGSSEPVSTVHPPRPASSRSPPIYATSLKVLRRNQQQAAAAAATNVVKAPTPSTLKKSAVEQLRHRRRDATVNQHPRRNTIAVNASDWEEVMRDTGLRPLQSADNHHPVGLVHSKSSECLSQRQSDSGPSNMQTQHTATLPKLRVRRVRPRALTTNNIIEAPHAHAIEPTATAGPEFIRNSARDPVELDITERSKCPPAERRTVSVLLLSGRTQRIRCNALTTTAQQIFETVMRAESFAENFFLGLCALIGGDFVFLPGEVRVRKVAPQIWRAACFGDGIMFTLFLRIRFLLPTLRGLGYVSWLFASVG